jgi:hypothetical protein
MRKAPFIRGFSTSNCGPGVKISLGVNSDFLLGTLDLFNALDI